MAVETPAVNMDKLMAFLGQVIGELGATVNAGLIVIGDRLGLYKAMAGAGRSLQRSWPRRPGRASATSANG